MLDELQQIIELHENLRNIKFEHYTENVVFSLHWWLLLIITILPWFIWWKLVDKNRFKEVLLYGFFMALIITIFDELGLALGLWVYPYQVFTIVPRSITADFTFFPVIYMLIYQRFIGWKDYLIAVSIFGVAMVFILEPIAVWANFYKMLNWKHLYSLPFYLLVPVIGKWFTDRL